MFSKKKHRRDIQVLRGLAVLAVVLFHTNERLFPIGYLGVDFFFVISGFVVTPLILSIITDQSNIGGRLSSLRNFYKRRFYRLAPALAAVLAISAILIFILGPNVDHQRFARQGIATLLLVGNIGAYRYSGDYFSPNPNPLVHTWSLSVEEQIYLFLPLILIPLIRNRKSLKKAIASVFGFLFAISFISFLFPSILQSLYSRAGNEFASQLTFYLPTSRVWQFTLGGLAFLFLDRYQGRMPKFSKSISFVSVIAVLIILFGPIHLSLKIGSSLASYFAVFVILFKSLYVMPNFLVKQLEWLGDRSYSIYLVHMPLLYLAKYSPVTQIGNSENRMIQSVLACVASILLGACSYSTIENRFRNGYKNQNARSQNLTVSLIITLLIPFTLFFAVDRAALNYRIDVNLPIQSKPASWEWDPKCQIMSNTSNIHKPCIYGNQESTKSILLIGDSHAASNSQAVIKVAKTNDMKVSVFTRTSCPFITNKKEFDAAFELPGLDDNCMQHNQTILNYINIHKPTIIVLSMRSTSGYIFPNTTSSRLLYRKNILRSLSNLNLLKTNIILIGAEPEYQPVLTWAERILGLEGNYSDIPFEDSRWWGNVSLVNFFYANTLDIFCPQNKCRNKNGSIWLFEDDHHLSKEGAELLLPELYQKVEEILRRNS